MESSKKYGWTESCILNKLNKISELRCFNYKECAIEAVDGEDASVVVLMNAVGELPISIMMNGKEVMVDIVLISMDREAQG